MSTFLLSYVEIVQNLIVQRFADGKTAAIYAYEQLPPHRTAKVVSNETDLEDRQQFSAGLLVAIYNAVADKPVTKFETHTIGARRTFATLYAKFNQLPVTELPATNPGDDVKPNEHPEGDHPDHGVHAPTKAEQAAAKRAEAAAKKDAEKVAAAAQKLADKTAKAAAKAAKAAAPREAKVSKVMTGQDAKPLSAFKTVRADTARARLLPLMDGTLTPDEVAVKMSEGATKPMEGGYVMQHAYCLHRDCGIGYRVTPEGKLLALYPTGKSLADAIKEKGAAPAAEMQEAA